MTRRGRGSSPSAPSYLPCSDTQTGLPRQTDRRWAGSSEWQAGIAKYATHRANQLQRQTSPTRPCYLFVTCLQPPCHHFGAVRLIFTLCPGHHQQPCAPCWVQEAELGLQCSSTRSAVTLLLGARGMGMGTGTGTAELRQNRVQSRAHRGMPRGHTSPLHWDSLLPSSQRTRNRNRSYTSLGHFSFPICFSTFLSLSRSSCSPRAAVSTGTGWKQGSNRSDRVNHLLMSSVPGVGGTALPHCSCEPRAGSPTALSLCCSTPDLLMHFLCLH